MGYRAALLSFSKGEISPEVESRFDLGAYQAGLRQARNVKVRRVGGVSKRMGTRFVAEAKGSASRLIPFQFSATQAYVLEFSQAVMRPIALGGLILEDGLCVTAITKEAQAKVTAAYHGYAVGDPVYFTGQQGMVEINDRFLEVTAVLDDSNFRVNFDSRNAGTWTGESVCITRSAPPAPPPPPPPVPAPEPTPEPPPTGGGGGGGYGSGGYWKPGLDPDMQQEYL